jgi:hypothetical protein
MTDAQPIALMSPVFPSPQLQLLLLHPINARKVQFFVGSVKSSSDLRRVKAADAMAVYIFVDSDIAEVSVRHVYNNSKHLFNYCEFMIIDDTCS